MTKKIVIIGGGIAGLTAATLLSEAGADVTILEASSDVGGLAKSGRTDKQFPYEHSLRVYHENYDCLFNIFKKIPYNEKETLYDQLVPIDLALINNDDIYHYKHNNKHYFFHTWYQLIKMSYFFYRQGFTIKDFLNFLKQDIYIRQCEKRIMKNKAPIKAKEFFDKFSPKAREIIFAYSQIAYVASDETSTLMSIELNTEGRPFKFFAMANGPTSERVFAPWNKYLISKGIKIHYNSLVNIIEKNDEKIVAVKTQQGQRFEADIFVSAISSMNTHALFGFAFAKQHNSISENTSFNHEWSNGAQFFLKALPKIDGKKNDLWKPGVLRIHLDSPWKIVSVIQGKGLWKNVNLPKECHYSLSITFCNVNTPGHLFNKKLLECTKEEIRAELLHQCGLFDDDLIIDWHLDDAIDFMLSEEYMNRKASLPVHAAYQRKNDWILNFSLIYTPTPDNFKYALNARTIMNNLYMSNTLCKTVMHIPTMEKACESGFWAAKAISEDFNFSKNIELPFSSYNTKRHKFFRQLDNVLYNLLS